MACCPRNQSSDNGKFICWVDRTCTRVLTINIGLWEFRCSANVSNVLCPDSPNWALWVRFHGRYWYQSFIDGTNIWGVVLDRPLGSQTDHPPLGRSYLVVVPSYDMSCALILLTGLYGCDSIVDNDINPSSMGPIFGVWIGPTIGVPK